MNVEFVLFFYFSDFQYSIAKFKQTLNFSHKNSDFSVVFQNFFVFLLDKF